VKRERRRRGEGESFQEGNIEKGKYLCYLLAFNI
jgi:hypothetical protein